MKRFALILPLLLLTVLFPLREASGAISHVQNVGTLNQYYGFGPSSIVIPVTASVTAGNSIIVNLMWGGFSSGLTTTCNDDQGNSYSADISGYHSGTSMYTVICSAHNVTALTTSDNITISFGGSIYGIAAIAHEFSGLASSSPLDQTSSANGSSTTPSSGSTATTTQADELLVGAIGVSGPPTDSFTPGSGYTALGSVGFTDAFDGTINSEYKIVSATGAYQADGTLSPSSRDWAAAIATYKAAVGISISGTVYASDRSSNLGANKRVRLIINGVDNNDTALTDASGLYSITAAVSAGDNILVYIDDDDGTTNDGVTVTQSNGSDLTGLDIYADHVATRHDNVGSLTNTLMNSALGAFSDTEIDYSISAGNLIVSGSGNRLFIPTGHSFTPGGNVTTQSIEIMGAVTAGANTFTINNDWDSSNGTFNYDTSLVVMAGTSNNLTTQSSGDGWDPRLYQLTIDTGADITVQTAGTANGFRVTNLLTLSGKLTVPSSKTASIPPAGDLSIGAAGELAGAGRFNRVANDTSNHISNSGTISIAEFRFAIDLGSTTAPVTATTYGGQMTVRNNGASSATGVLGAGNLSVGGNLVIENFIASYTTTLNNAVNNTPVTAAGLSLGTSGNTTMYTKLFAGSANYNISGDVTIYASDISGTNELDADTSTINVGGNWTNNDIFTADASTVTLNGVAQTVTPGASTFNHLTLNMTGQLTMVGNLDVNGNLTITSATTLADGDILVAGNVVTTDTTVNGSGTFPVARIIFDGTGAQTLSASGGSGAVPGVNVNKAAGTLSLQDTIELDFWGAAWTWTQGTVDPGTSTVIASWTGSSLTTTFGGQAFYNFIISLTAGVAFNAGGGEILDVNGDFTMIAAHSYINATVAGDLYINTTGMNGNTYSNRITIDGTGAQTYNGTGRIDSITIAKPSGTLTFASNPSFYGNSFIYTSGTVDWGATTFNILRSTTINSGSMAFGHVQFNGSTYSTTVTGTMIVAGTLDFTAVTSINGGTIESRGNIIGADAGVGGTASISLTGTGDQTISAADLPDGNLEVNKVTGNALLGAALSVSGNTTITQGVLDLSGYDLTLGGTFSNTGTLRLLGSETLTSFTNDTDSGTIEYNGTTAGLSLEAGNNYFNLAINGVSGVWTQGAVIDINGDLTINNGTLDVSASNYSINVAGDWSNSAFFTQRDGTVVLDGTNQTVNGSTTFYNLSKNVVATDTLTFDATGTQSIATGGNVSLNGVAGNLLQLRSSSTPTQWGFNVVSGATTDINYVDVQDSNASVLAGETVHAYFSQGSGANNNNWVFENLKLVKQVWMGGGSPICLASSPTKVDCNGGAITTVPVGSTLYFLIYVNNISGATASDIRFTDLLDDTGFTYLPNTLESTATGSEPADTASSTDIFNATTTARSDAFDGDTGSDEFTGIDTSVSPDNLTAGGNGGASSNDMINIPANKTFAIRFQATKN